jgi:putative exosortase-associated protein (TIGR04073 family)
MRIQLKKIGWPLLAMAMAAGLSGCASAEKKLGRGLNNMMEPLRGGELSRSFEQTYLWDGPDRAMGEGLVRGFSRTVGRTLSGVVDVVTFPIPTESLVKPADPVYPDAFAPDITDNPSTRTSNQLGFDSGDLAPFVAGSRFRVFR